MTNRSRQVAGANLGNEFLNKSSSECKRLIPCFLASVGFPAWHEGGVLERAQALGSERLVSIPILLHDDVNLLDFSFLIGKVGIMTTEMLLKSPHSAWLLIGSQQL